MNRFFGCPPSRPNRTAPVGRHVLAVAAAIAAAHVGRAASNLEFTVVAVAQQGFPAQPGTVAPGSGQAYNVPDGIFVPGGGIPDFELSRPVATDGLLAFRGTVQYTPPPQIEGGGIGRGIWGGGSTSLNTIAIGQLDAPGTPGKFTGQFGAMVLDVAGNLAFMGPWAKTTTPASSGTGIWYAGVNVGGFGDLEAVAISGQVAPGTGGAQFGNLNAGALYQNVGHIAFISGGLGEWTFEKGTSTLRRVSYTDMPVDVIGSGLTLTAQRTIVGLASQGRLLYHATTSDTRTRLFFASAPDAITLILSSGDDAPGLPGKRIGSMSAGLNIAGDVAISVLLDDGDTNFANNTTALYLRRESGDLELVTHGGAPLAGMPTGVWGGTPLINDLRRIFLPGLGIVDPFGGPGATPVYTALPPRTGSAFNFNNLGQVAIYAQDLSGSSQTLLLYQPGGDWIEVARFGTAITLPTPVVGPVTVNTIGFSENSGGSDGKATGLTNAGELVFTLNGRYVVSARIVAPDITVDSGTQDFEEFIPQIGKLTITGGVANLNGGVGNIQELEQTGGTNNIAGDTTVSGAAEISGGTVSGTGALQLSGGVTLGGPIILDRKKFFFATDYTSTAPLDFTFLDGATWEVAEGVTLKFNHQVELKRGDDSETKLINNGTIQYGNFGDPFDTSTLTVGVRYEGPPTAIFQNYRTVLFEIPFIYEGYLENTGEMFFYRPESSPFGIAEWSIESGLNAGRLRIGRDTAGREIVIINDFIYEGFDTEVDLYDATLDIRNATPDYLNSLRLRFGGTYKLTIPGTPSSELPLLETGTTTIAGPGNSVQFTHTILNDRSDWEAKTRLQYQLDTGSASALTLNNVSFRTGPIAITTNDGPVEIDLANSSYLIGGAWTLGGNVEVNPDDNWSYFGSVGDMVIPEGRQLAVTKAGAIGRVFFLGGSETWLDGEINADVRIMGVIPSASFGEWSGYREDRPLPATFDLGQSPGDGVINGNLTLGALATLRCELAGTQQGVTYDHLDLNGTLTINGGLLDLRFLNTFETTVQPADLFVLVEADAPIAGSFVNAPSGTRRNTADGLRSFEIHYGEGSPHGANRVVATNVGAFDAAAVPPTIDAQPAAQNATAGGNPTFTVTPSGNGPFTFQWYLDGVAIAGATGASHTIPSAQEFSEGAYTVVVSDSYGSTISGAASLDITTPPANTARLLNLSTRAQTLTGDNILIPGFVVSGTGTKRLLIRAVGPTLRNAPYNVAGALENPRMTLKRLDFSVNPAVYVDIGANDDWMTNSNAVDLADAIDDLFAFPFEDDREAALLVDLAPGQYTVFADGVANATGIAIVELYDADGASPSASLINISNRGLVGTGEAVMIPGFVTSSEGPKTLLVRVVGPTLANPPYNVPGTMADPRLQLFRKESDGSDTLLLEQDDWNDNADAANTRQTALDLGAFALDEGSADAAFVVTLPPGTYTVVGSSADGTSTGVVLVEVYVVP